MIIPQHAGQFLKICEKQQHLVHCPTTSVPVPSRRRSRKENWTLWGEERKQGEGRGGVDKEVLVREEEEREKSKMGQRRDGEETRR